MDHVPTYADDDELLLHSSQTSLLNFREVTVCEFVADGVSRHDVIFFQRYYRRIRCSKNSRHFGRLASDGPIALPDIKSHVVASLTLIVYEKLPLNLRLLHLV